MDDVLLTELTSVAESLDDRDEAGLLIDLFEIASRTEFVAPVEDDYTPFVYPH
jgi:hypothetical protein